MKKKVTNFGKLFGLQINAMEKEKYTEMSGKPENCQLYI